LFLFCFEDRNWLQPTIIKIISSVFTERSEKGEQARVLGGKEISGFTFRVVRLVRFGIRVAFAKAFAVRWRLERGTRCYVFGTSFGRVREFYGSISKRGEIKSVIFFCWHCG
jgi:hypothetical protein